jgi:putative oxidoreductase
MAASGLDKCTPMMLSVLRVVTAVIYFEHGTQKLFGFPAPPPNGLPMLMSLPGAAGVIEVCLAPFLLVGLFTRPVAFLLSGEMAIAYWISHFPRNFYPVLNAGDAAILYCFIFLFIACAGGGAWSLDRALRGKS